MPRKKKQMQPKQSEVETTAALMDELGVSEDAALKLIAKGTKPTKRKTKAEETTAALMAELGKKPAKKPVRGTRVPGKRKPKHDFLTETKKVLGDRQKVYDMISVVWNDPSAKGLRKDDVVGYIRGHITAEKNLDKETDFYLVDELWDLVALWRTRQAL